MNNEWTLISDIVTVIFRAYLMRGRIYCKLHTVPIYLWLTIAIYSTVCLLWSDKSNTLTLANIGTVEAAREEPLSGLSPTLINWQTHTELQCFSGVHSTVLKPLASMAIERNIICLSSTKLFLRPTQWHLTFIPIALYLIISEMDVSSVSCPCLTALYHTATSKCLHIYPHICT